MRDYERHFYCFEEKIKYKLRMIIFLFLNDGITNINGRNKTNKYSKHVTR